ncbi:hypothetical protein lbkm_0025 [Lachnospiraceae bacterium KM106-2]|nr:hypothetical protein lbkm_0025 [Lachnospiraceae bacterium KM106-2]
MRKLRYLCIIMSVVVIGILTSNSVHAKGRASYQIQRVDQSVHNKAGKVIAKFYYDRVILRGNTKAVKKINKDTKKVCDQFFHTYKKQFLGYVEDKDQPYGPTAEEPYKCYVTSKVAYNKNGIISIKQYSDWFAGGVANSEYTGLTYNTKSGKKLSIVDVIKGNSRTVKQKVERNVRKYLIKNSIVGSQLSSTMNIVKKKKIGDYNFYLYKNKVYVCFLCYELELGNDYTVVPMSRK